MLRLPLVRFGLIGGILMSAVLCGTRIEAVAADSTEPVSVADFTLSDYRGAEHSLSDYVERPIVVMVFLGTECPLVKLYAPRLAAMADEYADRGVQFLGINSNRQDAITEIANYARIHELQFPILKDSGNRLADRLQAERTPEVFVLDDQRVVRYRGRIDDQYGVGYIRDAPRHEELRAALDDLLADHPVSVSRTETVGCFIGRQKPVDSESHVTYSGQVASVLNRHCVECHREGEIAPFSLTTYEEAAGWADTIAEVVRDRRMPPWHANPKYGYFANDRSLPDADKQLLYDWAKAGAPQGDPAHIPETPTFVSGWQLPRKPDVVLEMAEPFTVPAEGGKRGVEYQYFVIDPKFAEDRWVTMAEAQPGNRAVVHHILVFIKPPDGAQHDRTTPGAYFTPYVPGLRVRPFPAGMAKLIPAGSKIVFQVHYTPIGSEQQDRSRLGLLFADPSEVTHRVVTVEARNSRLKIPPHEPDYSAEASAGPLPIDVQLLSFLPHMHLRGKAFRYEGRFPGDKSEILLDVPAYDFNWQTIYRLREPRILPAGTTMHCVARFDNSEQNLWNPDPSATVRWGEQTWDEMLIGYFDIAVPVEKESAQGSKPKPAEGAPGSRAAQVFERLDTDGDGRIDRDETPEKHRRHFNRIDADSSGGISLEELRKALGKVE